MTKFNVGDKVLVAEDAKFIFLDRPARCDSDICGQTMFIVAEADDDGDYAVSATLGVDPLNCDVVSPQYLTLVEARQDAPEVRYNQHGEKVKLLCEVPGHPDMVVTLWGDLTSPTLTPTELWQEMSNTPPVKVPDGWAKPIGEDNSIILQRDGQKIWVEALSGGYDVEIGMISTFIPREVIQYLDAQLEKEKGS